jgi:hypothetical protein
MEAWRRYQNLRNPVIYFGGYPSIPSRVWNTLLYFILLYSSLSIIFFLLKLGVVYGWGGWGTKNE